MRRTTIALTCILTAIVFLLTISGQSRAANGTWNINGSGDYNGAANWLGNTVASGAGFTANFNSLDITGDHEVTLNAPLTIGHFIFGDTNLASGGSWGITTSSVDTSIITLDNGGTSPTITANPISSATFDNSFIGNRLAGTAGFTKLGAGILELGSHGTTDAHTITGGIRIDQGTLRTLAALPRQQYTLAGGTSLITAAPAPGGNGDITGGAIAIAAGQTATVRMNTAGTMLPISGLGSTANLILGDNGLHELHGDWTAGGAATLSRINISTDAAVAAGRARFDINRGANNAFNGNAFATSIVDLDNVIINTRTNSNGNTVPIGELRGTSTAVLRGGEAGSAARYDIGGLNTNSTFSGVIDGNGGTSLNKVGTGTLTLAGTFLGDPTNNSLALAGQSAGRQGGVIRVTAGSLKLTGASAIPGGFGTVLTTIDVLSGATFDVSSTPATFATSNLQKIQGSGTVLGNYNHAAGQINPGDVGAPTPANENNLSAAVTPTAGTITFNGNLNLSGGNIIYDMSLNPAAGNDRVVVNGTTNLAGGRIVPNFLAGIPTSGTYTVLTSNSFTGSAANVLVDMPGRTPDKPTTVVGNALMFDAGGVVDGKSLTWTGSASGVWDIETTTNWTDGVIAEKFFNLDSVAFTEAGANKTITLNSTAEPAGTITMNNTSAYSFSGTGAITGAAGFTKTGGGALNMSLNNSFSGPASVTGSTVNVANFSGLGSGPLTLNNATYISTVSVSNSSLDIPAGTTSTVQLDGAVDTAGASNIPTLTGDGTLNLTSTVTNKFFGSFNTAGFTGTLNVAPSGAATSLGRIRIRGATTNFSQAVLNFTSSGMSNQQGAAADTSVTVQIGEIHGDTAATLVAFEGGSTPPDIVWQIGALNTSSDFAGVISDGAGSGGDASIASITKVGTGSLTLTGVNTYTGNTRVDGGTLSINNGFLADTSDVFIAGGSTFNLNFAGNDTIDALYLNGVPQAPGLYGATGLGSAFFSGTGLLQVTTLGPTIGVTGDYNNDGTVDAADFTVWRDNLGGAGTALANRDPANGAGVVSQADYTSWVANFGATGAGAGGVSLAAVPEPTSWLLGLLGLTAIGARRWR